MKDAASVGMMTAYHNYLITNLDLHLVDMEEFKYGGTNITSLRLVDPYRSNVQVLTDIVNNYGGSGTKLLIVDLFSRT